MVRYQNADRTDLLNWMFLNEHDKIITYIDHNYMHYAYDDIIKFIDNLAVDIISEGIEEKSPSYWAKDTRKCYKYLKEYYENERKINEERERYKKRQNTKKSLIQMG